MLRNLVRGYARRIFRRDRRQSCRATLAGREGFTLIEVLVAAVVLSLAYVAVLQNFSQATQNLVRIDRQRKEYFDALLAFESELFSTEEEDPEKQNIKEEKEGDLFWEGRVYNIVLIRSEDGRFSTLVLRKKS